MATPEERITLDGPVEIVKLPTSKKTVKGTPRKATAAEVAAFKKRLSQSQ